MTESVAVFGGSFNPPHVGHVFVVAYLLSMTQWDRVLVVPCFRHPFGKDLASFDVRLEMCEAAFGWMPRVEVSAVERELGGESRTLRTLRHLAKAHTDWALRLVIGTDVVNEAPRWHGFDEVEKLAPPIVLARKGSSGTAGTADVFPAVSSTQIREALAAGDIEAAGRWVPAKVLAIARDRALYQGRDG